MLQRGSFVIRVLILQALKHRRLSKTRLLQELVLNSARANRYIVIMLELGLIDYDLRERTYGITNKGMEYLEMSEQLACMVRPINDLVERYNKYFEMQTH